MKWSVLLTVPVLLAGCSVSPPPEYPVESLDFDQRLVGTWELVPERDDEDKTVATLTLAPSSVRIRDGRIDSRAPGIFNQQPSEQRPVYDVTLDIRNPDESEQEGADPPIILHLRGILLSLDSQRLLGLQPTDDAALRAGLGTFLVPTHSLWRVGLDADALLLEPPSVRVFWAPNVAWIDPVAPGAPPADTLAAIRAAQERPDSDDEKAKPTMKPVTFLTSDVDRLVSIYRQGNSAPDFWGEPMRFKRTK